MQANNYITGLADTISRMYTYFFVYMYIIYTVGTIYIHNKGCVVKSLIDFVILIPFLFFKRVSN